MSSAPEDEGEFWRWQKVQENISDISDHIGLHIRAVGQWTNRLLNFFEKEQERLHNGEVPSYEEQAQHEHNDDGKVMVQAYVSNSRCDRIDERSDGNNMKKNIMMARVQMNVNSKVPMEKAMSMPDMENKMKTHERVKKWAQFKFDAISGIK